MKELICLCMALIFSGCTTINEMATHRPDINRSIVKVQALTTTSKQNLGSGVVIAPDTVATNCHVMRNAKRAFLIAPEGLFPITAEAALPEKDICLLKTQQLTTPAVELADSDDIHVGDSIILSGYPLGMGRRTSAGAITALHPYRDSQIIEINTGFNHGASGGGVFNQEGKLIGLMTFMGKEKSGMHFYVLPSAWLEIALTNEFTPIKPLNGRSFWENGEFAKESK